MENLTLNGKKDKTKKTDDDIKKAKYGEEGQGDYLTDKKKKK